MKFRFVSLVAFVLSVFILSGCGGSKPAPKVSKAQHQPKFVIGKTTKSEIISLLGEPNGDSYNSKGEEILLYQSSHITGKAWIPFYHGTDRVRMKMQQYSFKDNVLTAFSTNSRHY